MHETDACLLKYQVLMSTSKSDHYKEYDAKLCGERYLAIPFLYDQYFSHADKSSPVVRLVPPNSKMKMSVAAAVAYLPILEPQLSCHWTD